MHIYETKDIVTLYVYYTMTRFFLFCSLLIFVQLATRCPKNSQFYHRACSFYVQVRYLLKCKYKGAVHQELN